MAPPPHVRRVGGGSGGGRGGATPSTAVARAGGGTSGAAAARAAKEAAETAREQAREAARQTRLINPTNYKHNVGVVYFLRIYMTIVAGAVVGILGVTGWKGFLFYLLSQALCALPIVALAAASLAEQRARARRRQQGSSALLSPPPLSAAPLAFVVPRCFHQWSQVLTEHVFGQTAVLSYLLCWMVGYNLAHVF